MFHLNRYLPYSIELSFTFHTLRVGIQSYMCEMCLDVVLLADQIKAFVFCKKRIAIILKCVKKLLKKYRLATFLKESQQAVVKSAQFQKSFSQRNFWFHWEKLMVSLEETF